MSWSINTAAPTSLFIFETSVYIFGVVATFDHISLYILLVVRGSRNLFFGAGLLQC